ncbi:hypothetical protein C1H46_001872 [Malus baccata]|uniref:Uncharacterized protein n=1 Tax=Malus baccata TaxID=106549 RepID=A0A540NN86_MALBA|nr:hypothetical protein C1H46_001872 [Malus baccata]
MAMSKTFTVCIVAFLVCSLCIQTTNADFSKPVTVPEQPSPCREANCMWPPPSSPPPSNPPPSLVYNNKSCQMVSVYCTGGRKLK